MAIDISTKMKRLKQLKHMLENHHKIFTNITFNMEDWARDVGCGTAACALGSAASYAPFNEEGLILTKSNIASEYSYPKFENSSSYLAGAMFFGLNLDDSEWLFYPEHYENVLPSDITPNMVAARVDYLIAKYDRRKP